MLSNLNMVLGIRYERSGDLADLEGSIRAGRDAVDSTPAGDPQRAAMLSNLSNSLRRQFERSGDMADLEGSISAGRDAVDSTPAGDPRRAAMLSSLATALRKKYERSGDPANLEEAISTGRDAVNSTPVADLKRSGRLSGLSTSLGLRFDRTGDAADLEEAVSVGRDAVNSIRAGHTDRASIQANFGALLRARFEQAGDLADLDEAISTGRDAVEVTPAGDPQGAGRMSNLSISLRARFERTGEQADLDEAISTGQSAVEAAPDGYPDHAAVLSILSSALQSRFERAGEQTDLEDAISIGREAVNATSASDAQRAWRLSNLSVGLRARFEQTGDQADLEEAITTIREAAKAAQGGRPLQAAILSNLGIALRARFGRTGEQADLDEAINAERHAIDATSAGRPDRASYLTGFGNALLTRFYLTRDPADLDEAISTGRDAAEVIAADQPGKATVLSNLGNALLTRFYRTGDRADLDEAIGTRRDAVHATPTDQPSRAIYLFNLGNALLTRFERTGSPGSAREAISAYADAANVASAPPLIRIQAAMAAAPLAAEAAPRQAAALLDSAVRLLPQTIPRQLNRSDQQHALSGFAFLASDAAALTLDTSGPASRALGLLELGRAVLHSQLLDTRSDITDLRTRHPALAARFLELRDQLDPIEGTGPIPSATASDPAGTQQNAAPDRRNIAADLAALLDQIRGLDGFGRFLLPPEPEQLTRHAQSGPIVVFSISRYRSDAITITPQAITNVHLPGLALETLTQKIDTFYSALPMTTDRQVSLERDFATEVVSWSSEQRSSAQDALSQVLAWLWDTTAEPVLDHLGYRHAIEPGAEMPRIWWAPGGLLSLLPLHAAGHHEQPGRGRTVMDRVISSYTPTARALGYARGYAATTPHQSLIVAMPTTPGASPLPDAAEEATMLQARLPQPTLLIEDPATTSDHTPTKANVLAHLAEAGIAHFACHAASDAADPSRSRLFLHDHDQDPLTVASLASIRLDEAQLAYLSACQTSRNASMALLDEAIHLTSAFQLAGYPHVIGTMWSIGDRTAAIVADTFYAHLLTHQATVGTTTTAAHALHRAVRDLRDHRPAAPSLWAAYLHARA